MVSLYIFCIAFAHIRIFILYIWILQVKREHLFGEIKSFKVRSDFFLVRLWKKSRRAAEAGTNALTHLLSKKTRSSSPNWSSSMSLTFASFATASGRGSELRGLSAPEIKHTHKVSSKHNFTSMTKQEKLMFFYVLCDIPMLSRRALASLWGS